MVKRTPPPAKPWCVIAKIQFHVLRVLKVPEFHVEENRLTEHGWTVIARDSDIPAGPPQTFFPRDYQPYIGQSNPRREHPDGEDIQRSIDNEGDC